MKIMIKRCKCFFKKERKLLALLSILKNPNDESEILEKNQWIKKGKKIPANPSDKFFLFLKKKPKIIDLRR
jgi:hypothetical protein